MKIVNYNSEKYAEIMVGYFKNEYPNMRLGQILCNTFVDGDWPELFYENEDRKAVEMFSAFIYENTT